MIFFRADGNEVIGSGHIMRCLSIAGEATESNPKSTLNDVLFIAADDSFSSVINSAGIRNHILNTDYRNMESELAQLEELMECYHPLAFFVDSYYVTKNYLKSLWELCHMTTRADGRETVERQEATGAKKMAEDKTQITTLIYLDDLLSFPYSCDYLINYNIYGEDAVDSYHEMYSGSNGRGHSRADNKIGRGNRNIGGEAAEPKYLLGTSYAPLRHEFQNLSERTIRETVTDIMISTGGSDPEHIALQLVKEVLRRDPQYTFHFIIGVMNTDYDEIERVVAEKNSERDRESENVEKYNRSHGRIVLHRNVKHMVELMQSSDLAISAAGSTLYELCATQTPTLTYILADNQIPGAEGFQNHGVLDCVGDYRKDPKLVSRLIDKAVELAEDYDRRRLISQKMGEVVDGKGCRRILDAVGIRR